MNRNYLSALVLASAALSGSSFAQGYAGVSAGQSRVDIDCSGTTSCDKSDTAFKILGGYMLTPNFGVEAAYYNQGKAKQTATDPQLGAATAEWKGDGFGAFGLAVLPFGNASVFAKLGLVSTKIKLDATLVPPDSAPQSGSTSERHTNFAWGLGAGYEFTKNIGARLEYERVRIKFQEETRNADLVTVGVVYRF
jgi:OmpA-OmpF porin, OOP family